MMIMITVNLRFKYIIISNFLFFHPQSQVSLKRFKPEAGQFLIFVLKKSKNLRLEFLIQVSY